VSAERTMFFSFGYDHHHEINGRVFGHDTVVKITAPDPRAVMFAVFGREWCTSYNEVPNFARAKGYPVVRVAIEFADAESSS